MELQTTISVVSGLVSLGAVLIVVGGFVRQQKVIADQVEDLKCEIEPKVDEDACEKRHQELAKQLALKAEAPLLEQRRVDHERRIELAHERAGEAKNLAHQIDVKLASITTELAAQTKQGTAIEARLASIEGCLRKMNGATT